MGFSSMGVKGTSKSEGAKRKGIVYNIVFSFYP